jgi:hypothetical protein
VKRSRLLPTLSILALGILLLSSAPSISANSPKPGSACSKQGVSSIFQGKKYICIKSGKKLIWDKGTKVSTSATKTNSAVPQYKQPSRGSKNLEICRVQETSDIRKLISGSNLAAFRVESISGFPKTESRVASKGTLRFIAIPIDWSDKPGEANFFDKWKEQFAIFSEWVATNSEGKLKVDVTLHNNWIRIPGNSESYSVPFSEASPQSGEFWQKVIPVIDPIIDFTNYQYVIFVLPSGQQFIRESIQELYPGGAIREFPPKEGKILAFMGTGSYFENWNVKQWSYFAHEIGHLIDFAHGGSGRDSGTMGGYDIMFSQDGPSRTLSGWWRFLSDWLDKDQVFCDEVEGFKDLDLTLIPINSTDKGVKVAILKISPSKVLVIESRRYTKFDNDKRQAFFQRELVKDDWNGVLVYEYDASLGHLQNFLTPKASNSALSEYNWDGTTRYISKKLEVVEYAGLKISVTSSSNFDSLKIARLTAAEINRPRPTPSPAPTPTLVDFGVEPFVFGGSQRTGETTAVSNWYGRFFRSYRVQVMNSLNPAAAPLFDSGIINDFRSPISVKISNLICSRDLVEVATFYSGLDGKGISTRIEQSAALSAVNIKPDGKCEGYWSNGAVGKG